MDHDCGRQGIEWAFPYDGDPKVIMWKRNYAWFSVTRSFYFLNSLRSSSFSTAATLVQVLAFSSLD